VIYSLLEVGPEAQFRCAKQQLSILRDDKLGAACQHQQGKN
jgi:hypothetical protein